MADVKKGTDTMTIKYTPRPAAEVAFDPPKFPATRGKVQKETNKKGHKSER
jgi:hypothetical protein